jgi:Cu+-exporting ATPase
MFFSKKEKLTRKIDGMKCMHCRANAEKALNEIDGVKAKVSLENKTASITLKKSVPTEVLVKAITDAGFSVIE